MTPAQWPKHLRGAVWTCDDRQLAPVGNRYATVEGFQAMLWKCHQVRVSLRLINSGDYVNEKDEVVLRRIR